MKYLMVGCAAVLLAAIVFGNSTVKAETEYHSTGIGKTYQNNYRSSCYWYAGPPPGSPCYQGVWSDTSLYASPALARVVEFAEMHDFACYDYYGVSCTENYNKLYPAPGDISMVGSYASTNHYFCGHYSCGYPTDVRGWADHQDVTNNGTIWTTSDGF